MFSFVSITQENFPVVSGLFGESKDDWVGNLDEEWLEDILHTEAKTAFIIYTEAQPIGYIQLEEEAKDSYALAIFITKEFRGQGLGSEVLRSFIENRPKSEVFKAYIEDTDFLTNSAFSRAGFEKSGPAPTSGFSEYLYR